MEPLEVRGVSAPAGRCTGKVSGSVTASSLAAGPWDFSLAVGTLRLGEGDGRGDGKEALAAARAADAARETEARGKDIKRDDERRGVASCSCGTLSELVTSSAGLEELSSSLSGAFAPSKA